MPPAGSPLSPKMESLAIPSQARRLPAPHHRQHSSSTAASLRLPTLPRFHPANFPSQTSSAGTTPATGPSSPQPPLSPRAYQKQYSDAQKQMYLYQRELIASASRQARGTNAKPTSPRLIPMGSPGPVTPLELEDADSYLTAGVNSADAASRVDKLINEEALRRGEAPGRPTSVGGR
ncbi:uncharacterized protein BDR25DRAFT_226995 [Lindgomyces ingoldianus]|uniref:Uncharacterized protein n=1 Tax=Lindgomyces ingoldianus TaxID=673940 RepID=A0ACB6QT16_9PLEO|nr:uncharacterized protein BDR25DRAFT_226995 [Lindgomyces ingoldianus]KAF2470129.1 hypothetical protein BDR25DRAFT_226995 [Lindgomyces ingoldianus]